MPALGEAGGCQTNLHRALRRGTEGGYKWYDAENKPVLFPFGYGLSYTTYEYSDLKVTSGKEPTVSFTVKNTGARAGAEVAEVYVSLPAAAGEPPKRLAGWSKLQLKPGESKEVSLTINPRELSIFDEAAMDGSSCPVITLSWLEGHPETCL